VRGLGAAIAVVTLALPTAAAQELPAGPGREVVTARCVACHETDLITQQRLSRAAWQRSIEKMVRWGAVVDTTEREPLLDYLAAHFTATPAAQNLVATAATEPVYKRACLGCHEDDLIEAQQLTRDGWVRTIDKMVRWGADVPPADKDALVNYLAARYGPR
jgi:cytochrome c5